MAEEQKKYVVYGMRAKCSEGSMENYISTDVGHGVVYQGQPLLNANDHTSQVNLTHFGDCHSKLIYEEAKKQADEKYKADADDGFFAKAGKFIAKNVTKAALTAKEYLGANKCELDTPLPWMFGNSEHMIDGAPALTMESQCACRFGGIISIVPEEEEAAESIEGETAEAAEEAAGDAEGISAVNIAPVLAKGVLLTKAAENSTEEGVDGPWAGVTDAIGKALSDAAMAVKRQIEDAKAEEEEVNSDRYYIDKYVNEETLCQINSRWKTNMGQFKEMYGEDIFEQLQNYMYEYGVTDKTSILMFLSAMGNESGYGLNIAQVKEGETYEFDRDGYGVPIIGRKVGIGLLQVTDENQEYFIKDLYLSSNDNEEKERILEYFGVTDEYLRELDSSTNPNLENAAGFIYEYYPVEASVWFWGGTKMNCAVFQSGDDQVNMTVNNYISYYSNKNANMDNVFLAVQYALNGRQNFSKGDIDDMCKAKETIWQEGDTTISINGDDSNVPNGWVEKESDWEKAKSMLEE